MLPLPQKCIPHWWFPLFLKAMLSGNSLFDIGTILGRQLKVKEFKQNDRFDFLF
jgi:hypothetical protein